jgi:hypothetical protein
MADFSSFRNPTIGSQWYSNWYTFVDTTQGYATQIDNANATHGQANLATTLTWLESHVESQISSGDSALQSQVTNNTNTIATYKTQIDNVNTNYAQANLLSTFSLFSTTAVMQQYVQSVVQGGPNIPAIGPALSVVTINGAGDAFTGLTYAQVYANLTANRASDSVVRINSDNTGFTGQTILDLQRELSFTRSILCDCFLF